MITIEQELAADIADAVEKIVAASHAAASKALGEAFGRGQAISSRRSNHRVVGPRPSRSLAAARRSSEEIVELAQKLHGSICAQPGETMAVLATTVGSTPRALQLPLARLKTEGRVKAIGERRSTRYFPLGATPAPTS